MIAECSWLAARRITSFTMGSSVPGSGIAAILRVELRRSPPGEFAAIAVPRIVLMAGKNVGSTEGAIISTFIHPGNLQYLNPRSQW
jgi:hypothetical protein